MIPALTVIKMLIQAEPLHRDATFKCAAPIPRRQREC